MEHSRDFFWHRVRWSAVAGFLPQGQSYTVVDVGAGIGLAGDFLARDRPLARYQFVEPIEALKSYLEGVHGAASNVEGVDAYDADFVILLDVLEHQQDDDAFITDLIGRMRPGARLVITVPALRQLWSGWDVALGHFRRYSRRSLRAVLTRPGVQVIEVSYLFPEMLPLALVRRFQRRADPGAAGADDAAFPDLPPALNSLLVGVGSLTLAARRIWPAGTSVLAVVKKVTPPS